MEWINKTVKRQLAGQTHSQQSREREKNISKREWGRKRKKLGNWESEREGIDYFE